MIPAASDFTERILPRLERNTDPDRRRENASGFCSSRRTRGKRRIRSAGSLISGKAVKRRGESKEFFTQSVDTAGLR